MNIFITGGAGFIGSHLTKHLNNQGHKITIFDNFSNSSDSKINLIDSNIKIIKGDILDYSRLSYSLKNTDVIIHLAAQISVADSIRDPENTMKINVDGTINVLNACLENNVKNIISASTAAVFGNQVIMPITENSPKEPISPYGKSKMMMEEKIIEFSKKNNLNSIIFRFFNLYGIGQSPQYAGVITKFLEKIKKNQPLEIYGDGKQTRDFIHISDIVECIDLAIKNIHGKSGKIYNIGTGNNMTILELAKLLLKVYGKNLEIHFKPRVDGDVVNSKASTELVLNELGFKPKMTIEKGLEQFRNPSES